MSDIETTVRNLAAIAAAKKLLAEAEAREKAALAGQITRGTAYAYTAAGVELGYATVPKPTQPKPVVTITDEAQVFPWLVETFGPDVIEERVVLTEQGRASLDAYVLEAHKAAGPRTTSISRASRCRCRPRAIRPRGSRPRRTLWSWCAGWPRPAS